MDKNAEDNRFEPVEVLDVRPFADEFGRHRTGPVLTTDGLKVMRIVLPAGKSLAEHRAPGAITVQCLEGRVEFTAGGQTHEISSGYLVSLVARQPHAVKAVEDASLLVTISLPNDTEHHVES